MSIGLYMMNDRKFMVLSNFRRCLFGNTVFIRYMICQRTSQNAVDVVGLDPCV